MPLANPVVARLAAGDATLRDEFCGLVLICNWPTSEEVQARYASLRGALAQQLPASAYLYPPATLHCTVCTLRAFPTGALDAGARADRAGRWTPILDAARASERWPKASFRLRMNAPTLDGAAGIIRYEDVDGAIGAMRDCMREAISAAGGLAAEGGGDRTLCRPPDGSPEGEPAPHLPDIVHSTALRWAAEPSDEEYAAAQDAFAKVAADWEPLPITIDLNGVVAVFEDIPFMHIPHDEERIWWRA
jgi:hypothetical protein